MPPRPVPSSSDSRRKRLHVSSRTSDSSDSDDCIGLESYEAICQVPLWHWPPSRLHDPWPSRPTDASQHALRAAAIPPDAPSAFCPCCLQPAYAPGLFVSLLLGRLPVRDWVGNVTEWEFYCIHCHLVFNAAVLDQIRTWVFQYIAFDSSLKTAMYIRGELLYVSSPHSHMVRDLDGEHRHRPLAYLREAVLAHPPAGHSALRVQQRVAPWPADARSVLLAVCPNYTGSSCGCNACNERLTRKCNGLQSRRTEPDSYYIIR